jgi:hypothetical protein
MMAGLRSTLSREQRREFRKAGPHIKEMLLLGKQMEKELTRSQQRKINLIVKRFLLKANAFRQKEHELPSMTKAALPQGIEVTMKMSQDWEKEHDKEKWWRAQGGGESEEDER